MKPNKTLTALLAMLGIAASAPAAPVRQEPRQTTLVDLDYMAAARSKRDRRRAKRVETLRGCA